MTAIPRFALHGTIMNPHSSGPYVRHEDHLAAMQARCLAQIEEPAGAAPAAVAGPAWDVTLDEDQAGLLRDMLGDREAYPEAITIRLLVGDGHSGHGLYVAQAEYQDEGAVLLASLPAPAAPALEAPAAHRQEGDVFRALIEFLLVAEEPLSFLRCWNEGSFDSCRREWPEAPEALYPLAAAPQAPNCTRCSGSGEDPEGYLTHGRGPDDHTVDGPCRSCDGTGAAPQAPAAPVVLPGPAAWTLQSELDAKRTTTSGHLWFTDPVNCLWTGLYTEQQVRSLLAAAPAAPSGLPHGWAPCILTHDGQHPEEVAYGPQIMMDRLKKWLGRYFELLAQKVLDEPVHAEMLAALQAVAMDVVHVGAGENAISDAARAKVEAVLERIGAPWPGPAAAPAAPAVDAPTEREFWAVIAPCGHGVIFEHEKDAQWTLTGEGTGADGFGVPTIGDSFRDCYGDDEIELVRIRVAAQAAAKGEHDQ